MSRGLGKTEKFILEQIKNGYIYCLTSLLEEEPKKCQSKYRALHRAARSLERKGHLYIQEHRETNQLWICLDNFIWNDEVIEKPSPWRAVN